MDSKYENVHSTLITVVADLMERMTLNEQKLAIDVLASAVSELESLVIDANQPASGAARFRFHGSDYCVQMTPPQWKGGFLGTGSTFRSGIRCNASE